MRSLVRAVGQEALSFRKEPIRTPMTIATHPPLFLPWPGFFAKAFRADALVVLDEVQFPLGRSWISRNRIKNERGELWLTVPVRKSGRGKQRICEVEICEGLPWRKKHLSSLRQAYAHAPYRKEVLLLVEAIYGQTTARLVDLNLALLRLFWEVWKIPATLLRQSELAVEGKGTELLVDLCEKLHATRYLLFPFAAKFLDLAQFRSGGIEPVFLPFRPPVYPQLWGEFRYNLSALDLLLNCGAKGRELLA
ncbi:hypothetical protein MAMC_00697 [Methylacidimicrobium cyclopophantes]|uniref:WbqC-like protein family protein n=1 Tax=Methylacidimicrobium cyclopophantes TaxID=1041766 RepID=A0A5E6M8R3_9BACT|nr:WbqC family protein [Methylacidimicrobium cyclopophantes]VVM05586.1 hypothetical protein MAMC_00697 [Methylacidimicrobium cyclopophantes]